MTRITHRDLYDYWDIASERDSQWLRGFKTERRAFPTLGRRCLSCGGSLWSRVESGARYCDRVCRDQHYQRRWGATGRSCASAALARGGSSPPARPNEAASARIRGRTARSLRRAAFSPSCQQQRGGSMQRQTSVSIPPRVPAWLTRVTVPIRPGLWSGVVKSASVARSGLGGPESGTGTATSTTGSDPAASSSPDDEGPRAAEPRERRRSPEGKSG